MKRVKEQPGRKAVDGDQRREKNTLEWEKIVDKQRGAKSDTKKKRQRKREGER